jgi:hypothetical protein
MKMERRPWTQAKLDRLENLVGPVSSATIAKRLRRPESRRQQVEAIGHLPTRSRRLHDASELELCLGEDHYKIAGWITNGWLQDRLQGTHRHNGNGNDIHRIREQDVLDFIRNHPQGINLGKVDQTWFLDLVLLKGREVREVTHPRLEQGPASDGQSSVW